MSRSAPRALACPPDFTVASVAAFAGELFAWIDAQREPAVDASGISDLDAAALQLLLMAGREAQSQGKRLRLLAAGEPLRESARLLGMEGLLDLDGETGESRPRRRAAP